MLILIFIIKFKMFFFFFGCPKSPWCSKSPRFTVIILFLDMNMVEVIASKLSILIKCQCVHTFNICLTLKSILCLVAVNLPSERSQISIPVEHEINYFKCRSKHILRTIHLSFQRFNSYVGPLILFYVHIESRHP